MKRNHIRPNYHASCKFHPHQCPPVYSSDRVHECKYIHIFKVFFLKQFTTSNNEQNKQKNWNTLYIMIFYKTRKDTCLEKKIAIRVCTFIFISPFLWIFSLVFGEESQWYSFKKKLLINSYKKINCTCHHNADVNCFVQIRTVSKRVWAARNLTKEKVGY